MNIHEQELACANQTMAALGAEVTALDDVLFHLSDGCANLSRAEHDRGPRLAALLLLTRAWNSLWRARVAALSGYYVQAFILCRAAYEDWGVLEYIDMIPGEADHYLQGITLEAADYNTPKWNKIWPVVEQRMKMAGAMYGDLCKMSHPTGVSLRWSVDTTPDTWIFRVGPYFDVDDARAVLVHLLATAVMLWTPIERLHLAMLGGFQVEWQARGRPLVNRASEAIGVPPPRPSGG